MELTKGTILKARGGWDAEVVWVAEHKCGFYAIHKPGVKQDMRTAPPEIGESGPIWHTGNGAAVTSFSVNEAPFYDGHPADLEMGEYEL